jgi:hypothetical protein
VVEQNVAFVDHLGNHGDVACAHRVGGAESQNCARLGGGAAVIATFGLIPPTGGAARQGDAGNFAGVGSALQHLRRGRNRDESGENQSDSGADQLYVEKGNPDH